MSAPAVSMRTRRIPCPSPGGQHMVSIVDWGSETASRTALCVHGLTRNARDFDRLAEHLADEWRVIAVDVVGRGKSDWLEDAAGYTYRQYIADMLRIVDRLHLKEVDWIGTSMGGIIGMMIAAQPDSPIKRLVLNDVGPHLTVAALRRIASYLGTPQSFASLDELKAHLKEIYSTFGMLPDSEWGEMAQHGHRRDAEGRYWLSHDPKIAQAALSSIDRDIEMWDTWDKIRCPVLLLRGENSDLVSGKSVEQMQHRGPRTQVVEIPNVGHAPALRTTNQIKIIRDWLKRTA